MRPARPLFFCQTAAIAACLALTPAALAQKIINIPSDQPSIQAGINAASPGDTVLVAPGTYYENIDFHGKAITVTSQAGPSTTILDGSLKGPVVSFQTAETHKSIISSFTIRNGGIAYGQYGVSGFGGVYSSGTASPSILNNVITANRCNGLNVVASPLIQGNLITGTLYYQAVPANPLGGCNFSNGTGLFHAGGGVYGTLFTNAYPVVSGNTFENNGSGPSYNSAASAMIFYFGGSPVVTSNIVRNNGDLTSGPAITLLDTNNFLFIGNLVTGNTSGTNSGGLEAGVPVFPLNPVVGVIANNTFANNHAKGSVNSSQVDLAGDLAQYDFVNNIIAGNDALPALSCEGNILPPGPTPLVVDHNDIFNPIGPGYAGLCANETESFGNIARDPLFVNAANGDFHLQPGSPAIDAGNNSVLDLPSLDVDGNPRVLDTTGALYPIVDMGAYEAAGEKDANPTTVILTPSAYVVSAGAAVTLSAHLISPNGIPSGVLNFTEDGTDIGSATIDANGNATLLPPAIQPGVHGFSATYAAQAAFTPAVAVKVFVVVSGTQATLSLGCSPSSVFPDQTINLNITVASGSGTAAGSVTVTSNQVSSGPLSLTNGAASATFGPLPIGSDTLVASYNSSNGFASPTASCIVTVAGHPTSTNLSITPPTAPVGRPVTLSASVLTTAGMAATGSVAFSAPSGTLGTASISADGSASITTANLPIGTQTIVASYSGSATLARSFGTAAVSITAAPTTTILSASPTHSTGFQPILLIAHVTLGSGAPASGSVTFATSQGSLGTASLAADGSATLSVSALAPGTHILTATYAGSASFLGSTSAPVSILLDPAPTALTLTASASSILPTQSLTLRSNVTAPGTSQTPAGTITFTDVTNTGAPVLLTAQPAAAGGTLSFALSLLTPGVHEIAASFEPQTASLFNPSTAPNLSITVLPQDFSITLSTPTLTIATEHHATLTITLNSLGGFADQVKLSCANLPAIASCTFAQDSLNLPANGTLSTKVIIDTDAVLQFKAFSNPQPLPPQSNRLPTRVLVLTALLPAGMCLARRRIARTRSLLLVAWLLVSLSLLAVNGCSGKYPDHTPTGAYTLTLTAQGVASTLTHSLPIPLNVTPE